ncbi:MAG: 5'/3'-nucleotidase SurE [Hyphomicrobiaceae bacterium]|nr:5'/3'-nucleotidase SurE [Hyphomicrobiaceae bacterium]
MRILLSNDDGIDAPGLALLASAARLLSPDVRIIAPVRKWTAASHQLSFDRTIDLVRVGERTYSCTGAPADCIVAAMMVPLDGGQRPDVVLSGVNDDRNVGEDTIYSGTLAVAREATFWGIPAVGFSRPRGSPVEEQDAPCLARLIGALWEMRRSWALEGHYLSINLPRRLPATAVEAKTGRDKIASEVDVVSRDGDALVSFRIRRGRPGTSSPGDEASAVAAGRIAVVRHAWFGAAAPLPAEVLARLSSAGTADGDSLSS